MRRVGPQITCLLCAKPSLRTNGVQMLSEHIIKENGVQMLFMFVLLVMWSWKEHVLCNNLVIWQSLLEIDNQIQKVSFYTFMICSHRSGFGQGRPVLISSRFFLFVSDNKFQWCSVLQCIFGAMRNLEHRGEREEGDTS